MGNKHFFVQTFVFALLGLNVAAYYFYWPSNKRSSGEDKAVVMEQERTEERPVEKTPVSEDPLPLAAPPSLPGVPEISLPPSEPRDIANAPPSPPGVPEISLPPSEPRDIANVLNGVKNMPVPAPPEIVSEPNPVKNMPVPVPLDDPVKNLPVPLPAPPEIVSEPNPANKIPVFEPREFASEPNAVKQLLHEIKKQEGDPFPPPPGGPQKQSPLASFDVVVGGGNRLTISNGAAPNGVPGKKDQTELRDAPPVVMPVVPGMAQNKPSVDNRFDQSNRVTPAAYSTPSAAKSEQSPWLLRMEPVGAQTRVIAQLRQLSSAQPQSTEFRIVCDRFEMVAPNSLQVAGKVTFLGAGLKGGCQKLTLPFNETKIVFEGNVEIIQETTPAQAGKVALRGERIVWDMFVPGEIRPVRIQQDGEIGR